MEIYHHKTHLIKQRNESELYAREKLSSWPHGCEPLGQGIPTPSFDGEGIEGGRSTLLQGCAPWVALLTRLVLL
jgi:hypothetical protein